MRKVSFRQAIVDAIEMTEPGMGRYMNFLIKWARYIENAIDSNTGHPIVSKLVIADGCNLLIPDDSFHVLKLLPGDHTSDCLAYYKDYNNALLVQDPTIPDWDLSWIWQPMNASPISELLWKEYGDKIYLTSEYKSQPITIIYQQIETDPEGMWIVNESHIDAITKFLIYKYAMKFQFKALMSDKMVRNSYRELVMGYERDYNIAVRSARADDGRASLADPPK
jgi:hypothetical protein